MTPDSTKNHCQNILLKFCILIKKNWYQPKIYLECAVNFIFSTITPCYVHFFIKFFKCIVIHFRVLVGTGRACFETLRPLAYSLLAEIVHHVRGDLSLSQVLLFVKRLKPSFATSIFVSLMMCFPGVKDLSICLGYR